jgi:hypothetical protein
LVIKVHVSWYQSIEEQYIVLPVKFENGLSISVLKISNSLQKIGVQVFKFSTACSTYSVLALLSHKKTCRAKLKPVGLNSSTEDRTGRRSKAKDLEKRGDSPCFSNSDIFRRGGKFVNFL